MARAILTLEEAAEHVHLSVNDLRHFAQRGEVHGIERDGEWRFEHRALDEWAQRNLLAASERSLAEQHRSMSDENRRAHRSDWGVGAFFRADGIDLALRAKGKGGVLRDLTELAEATGLVYDKDALFQSLVEREEAASTAIGCGCAFPHARYLDEFMFSESFIVYARAANAVYFGASDGEPTRHFFLVCTTDHEIHLHILARLAVLVHGTDFVERLDAAETPEDALLALRGCEAGFMRNA